MAVLVRFAISRYLDSPLYTGHAEPAADAEVDIVVVKPGTPRGRKRTGKPE